MRAQAAAITYCDTRTLMHDCHECGKPVLRTFNRVYLDCNPNPRGEWGLLQLGGMTLAAAGGSPGATRFELHEHQPGEHDV